MIAEIIRVKARYSKYMCEKWVVLLVFLLGCFVEGLQFTQNGLKYHKLAELVASMAGG